MDSTALPARTRLTQAELARQLGVARQSINELVSRGILVMDSDNKLDLEEVRTALLNSVHPGSKTALAIAPPPGPAAAAAPAGAPADEKTPMSFHTAKTLRETSEAAIAQLKLQELRGDLVKVADVRAAMSSKVAALREALLQIPSRLTPVLAAETDPLKIYAALDAELRAALEFVSQPTERTPTP